MSLQDWFYTIGLIYMTLGIILLLALVVFVFYIKKKVDELQRTFEEKMAIISRITSHPAETAVDIGASLADLAIDKIKGAFEGKKRKTT